MIVKILAGFFKIHPATVATKTFASGLAAILACGTGICTMIVNGDQNPIDYIAAIAGAMISAGSIFHRDAITKLGTKIEGFLPKQ